jgi:hypothetical protein
MAIGPDGQEDMHVGMASFPHPASSRARPSAPTIVQPFRYQGPFDRATRHGDAAPLPFQGPKCRLSTVVEV